MNNETCNKCGRPMAYCTEGNCGRPTCQCQKNFCCGSIQQKATASCPDGAVIPSITVDRMDQIKGIYGSFVHVAENNTTLYVDENGRVIITWAGQINVPDYDMISNPDGYRDQIVTDTKNKRAAIYDRDGIGYLFSLTDDTSIRQAVDDKINEMAQDGSLAALIERSIKPYVDSRDEATLQESKAYTDEKVEELKPVKTEYIFNKFWPGAYSGDVIAIRNSGKVILIDTHVGTQWNNVRAMMVDNGISHIDCVIITHYHADHVGNFKNLVESGYIDADTKIYMPTETTTSYATTPAEYKQYCSQHGLTYGVPTEYEEYNIGTLKLTFFNCNKEEMEPIYGSSDYNNYSTVVKVSDGELSHIFMGDCGGKAYARTREKGFIDSQITLYKIGHHGINSSSDWRFTEIVSPTFAVQTTGIRDEIKNNYGVTNELRILDGLGAKIYPTSRQKDYLKFESDGKSMWNTYGIPYLLSNDYQAVTLYADISVSPDAFQDGTQEHPYREVMQAVAEASRKNGIRRVDIYLADGHYCTSHEATTNEKNMLTVSENDAIVYLHGNTQDRSAVIIESCRFYNANVRLANLTINPTEGTSAILSYSSDVILENVNIEPIGKSEPVDNIAIVCYFQTRLHTMSGTRVHNFKNVATIQDNSQANFMSLVIGKISGSPFIDTARSFVQTSDVSFEDMQTKKATRLFRTRPTPEVLYSGEATSTFDLPISLAGYEWFEITYTNAAGRKYKTGKITNTGSSALCLTGDNLTSNGWTKYGVNATVTNTRVQLGTQTTLTFANGQWSMTTGGNAITILKIVAGFSEETDKTTL